MRLIDVTIKRGIGAIMFVAGVIGVVVVGVVSHGDYSDYSDHRNYSQYGDAYLVAEIKAKEAEIEKQRRDIELIQKRIDEKYRSALEVIQNEELLNEAYNKLNFDSQRLLVQSPLQFKEKLLSEITHKIEQSLEADKKRLNEIDALILKINKLQLSQNSNVKQEHIAAISAVVELKAQKKVGSDKEL